MKSPEVEPDPALLKIGQNQIDYLANRQIFGTAKIPKLIKNRDFLFYKTLLPDEFKSTPRRESLKAKTIRQIIDTVPKFRLIAEAIQQGNILEFNSEKRLYTTDTPDGSKLRASVEDYYYLTVDAVATELTTIPIPVLQTMTESNMSSYFGYFLPTNEVACQNHLLISNLDNTGWIKVCPELKVRGLSVVDVFQYCVLATVYYLSTEMNDPSRC